MLVEQQDNGARHPLFLTDLEEILKRWNISEGTVSGRWTFTKRGANYGVRMVFPETEIDRNG